MKNVCADCGKEFEHKYGKKYCPACEYIDVECAHCGKIFSTKSRKQKFHNEFCKNQSYYKSKKEGHKPKEKVYVVEDRPFSKLAFKIVVWWTEDGMQPKEIGDMLCRSENAIKFCITILKFTGKYAKIKKRFDEYQREPKRMSTEIRDRQCNRVHQKKVRVAI